MLGIHGEICEDNKEMRQRDFCVELWTRIQNFFHCLSHTYHTPKSNISADRFGIQNLRRESFYIKYKRGIITSRILSVPVGVLCERVYRYSEVYINFCVLFALKLFRFYCALLSDISLAEIKASQTQKKFQWNDFSMPSTAIVVTLSQNCKKRKSINE